MSENENKRENIPDDLSAGATGTYKTLQQLALEYGITRQGVKARINKMLAEVNESGGNESDYITRGKQGAIYVQDKGLKWLAKWNADNTPMQAPTANIDLELYKLKQAEQRAHDLESQIELLSHELAMKNNQINGLTAALMQVTKALPDKSNQATEPSNSGEHVETTTPKQGTGGKYDDNSSSSYDAPQAPNSHVSLSDEQIIAELSKRGFMAKIKLLFSK